MVAFRILAVVAVMALWGGVGWVLMQRKRIVQSLASSGSLPRAVPRHNFLLLVTVVLFALSGLVLYIAFG